MLHVFVVNGYGVPKDIVKDDNYHFYLNMVFNRIWDIVDSQSQYYRKFRSDKTVVLSKTSVSVILSGGKTDCFPPYRRTEAGEMKKLFVQMMRRGSVRGVTKHWKILTQTKALTTVENLIYGKEIIARQGIRHPEVFYFCETTRAERSMKLVKRVFPKSWKPLVIPIDFDISPQRYLSEKLLKAREEKALQYELWALKNQKNLKAWREVYQERIQFLRNAGSNAHHEAVKEWWEKKLANLFIKSF